MRTGSSRGLRFLLGLYVLASMTYFVARAVAVFQQRFHSYERVEDPFEMDYDTMALTKVSAAAGAAGLAKGDIVESLDNRRYTGAAQWMLIDHTARPGDMLRVEVRDPNGERRTATIHLAQAKTPSGTIAEWLIYAVLSLVCPLVCLVLGYWVTFARPRDSNAWLILLFLSFPEVMYGLPNWWSGGFQAFLEFWYQTLQIIAPIVVVLIGISFLERWRFDKRVPWLKWVLIIPLAACLVFTLIAKYGEYYHPSFGGFIHQVLPWVDRTGDALALACLILYFAAIFDKLRSASTADGRRRMQVLCTGSVLGLGSLLIIFVLLPALGVQLPKAVRPWLVLTGALLVLAFPFSLAYVVVVQRALDVRILLRMGTKYALARATLAIVQFVLIGIVTWKLMEPLLAKNTLRLHDLIVPLILLAVFVVLTYFGLGRRLQGWIDRKFFREAYTAELILHELSEEARTLTESSSLITTVCRRISEVLHVPQIGVLLRGGHVFRLQEAFGMDLAMPVTLSETSHAVLNLTPANRPATVYREDPDSWYSRADEEEQRALNAVNAEVLLPLPGRQKLMGLMTLGPKLSEEPYSPSDLRLLQSVATQTGLALEVSELAHSLAREAAQRERSNREMEIAREVQERLFPQTIPQIPGIGLAGACRPAQGVGGDYYDFIELEDGRLGLAIGDVSGKGISAALLMASLRASLRGMMLEDPHDVARVMSNVNRLVYEASTSNRYATFFFGIFDPATRELKYVNAGHNPPVVLRGGTELTLLDGGGPIVGLLRNLVYQEQKIRLERGNMMLAYTDGISEAMTASEEEWGEKRMIETAQAAASCSADEVIRRVFAGADGFTKGAPQHDDMTLLVMKVEGFYRL